MLAGVGAEVHDVAILRLLDLADFYSLTSCLPAARAEIQASTRDRRILQAQVDLRRPNLEWITDISSHEDFRVAVREWQVGNWSGRGNTWKSSRETPLGDDGHWPRVAGGHLDLMSSFVQQFTKALLRFFNCTSATVTDNRARVSYFPQNINSGPEQNLTWADAVVLMLYALSVLGETRV